jgi:translation initiation factor IF-2
MESVGPRRGSGGEGQLRAPAAPLPAPRAPRSGLGTLRDPSRLPRGGGGSRGGGASRRRWGYMRGPARYAARPVRERAPAPRPIPPPLRHPRLCHALRRGCTVVNVRGQTRVRAHGHGRGRGARCPPGRRPPPPLPPPPPASLPSNPPMELKLAAAGGCTPLMRPPGPGGHQGRGARAGGPTPRARRGRRPGGGGAWGARARGQAKRGKSVAGMLLFSQVAGSITGNGRRWGLICGGRAGGAGASK